MNLLSFLIRSLSSQHDLGIDIEKDMNILGPAMFIHTQPEKPIQAPIPFGLSSETIHKEVPRGELFKNKIWMGKLDELLQNEKVNQIYLEKHMLVFLIGYFAVITLVFFFLHFLFFNHKNLIAKSWQIEPIYK